MTIMDHLFQSIQYVINGHMFWGSMGFTTASAMFIGGMIYTSRETDAMRKGLITVLSYGFFLFYTSFARIYPRIANGEIYIKSFASSLTIIFVTLFYVVGLMLGHFIITRNGKRKYV